LLDIGSGPGHFLLQGKHSGWKPLEIELSRQAASYSRNNGLEIIEQFFSPDVAGTIGQFDAVHLSEALEHIPDPASLLHLVHQVLSTGGMLCVVVPNDYNPFQEKPRKVSGFEPWWGGCTPSHKPF
jgi:2-polyprenyl-3-methyl-5-hydroxy-6-metoxy-1,4-benzoquinol methylase